MTDILDAIRYAMLSLTEWAWVMTVVCHPDDEEMVQAALDATPAADKRVRLLVRRLCKPGETILFDDSKLDIMEPMSTASFFRDLPSATSFRFMSFPLNRDFTSVTVA